MNIFTVKNLSYSFNGKNVLDDICFDIEQGEFFGIAGPNGAGKSTLLRILACVLHSKAGKVFLADKPLKSFQRQQMSQLLAVLPAEIYVPYDFSVREIILMGRSPHIKWWKDYSAKDENVAERIMTELHIANLAERNLNSLSSGERQKVFIAQALCQFPKVLLLDEPTSHLDIHHQIEIFSLLEKLCKTKKLTIVVVSHDINLLSRYCRKILMLKDGRINSCGPAQEVITQQNISDVYGASSSIAKVTPFGHPHVYITGINN
jgi:iron complex transport system ATP-binding protein